MAKRRRFSRWRRLPGVYRIGEDKPTDPHLEPQRLTLYLPGVELDRAELQAVRLGFRDAQEYCTELLQRAIDAENVREHVSDVESRRGVLEGLHEIAEDVEYLTELRAAASTSRDRPEPPRPAPPPLDELNTTHVPVAVPVPLPGRLEPPDERPEVAFLEPPEDVRPHAPELPALPVSVPTSRASEVILRHAGQAGDDPYAFLPCLRRGESVPPAEVGELAQALHELERDFRGASVMDRGLTFALHRLAFESQILQTDAWPGAFDLWTVDMVRAVQEAVERILSGQDIRYFSDPIPDDPGAGASPPNLPEIPR